MPLLETRSEGLWGAKQPAKGTPATTADKRFRKVGGDLNPNREDGAENYSEDSRFGDTFDYVNTLVGDGAPVFQGQAGTLGWASAMLLGTESSVAQVGTSGNYDHVAIPGTGAYWLTFWKKVGSTVGPLRQQFNDIRPASLRIEGSSANKVVKGTFGIPSLDPGVIFVTDPVKTLDADDPFVYTEGEGRFTIDGEVYRGHSAFAVVVNDNPAPWYGDAVTPYDVSFGVASVTLEGITLALDGAGLERYYEQIYGSSAPPTGARPLTTIPGLGSYSVDLRKGSHQRIAITGGPTGGSVAVTVPGRGTATIAWNSTAAQAETAFESVVGRGKVDVSGGPLPGTALTVVFKDVQATLTKVDSLTGGTTPASAITDNGYHRGVKIEVPGVKWSPDVAVAGNPDGGPTELALGAEARAVAGEPRVKVTTRSGDAVAY